MSTLEDQALALIKRQKIYKTQKEFDRNVLHKLNEGGCSRYLGEESEGYLTVVCT